MRWLVPLVALAFVLAGSIGNAKDETISAAGGAGDAYEFHGEYERHVSGAIVPAVVHFGYGPNCLKFTDDLDEVLGVTVTVTWNAATPLTEHLEIVAFGIPAHHTRIQGASPLTLDFDEIPIDDNGLGISVQLTGWLTASWQQEVQVEVRLEYLGDPVLEPDLNWSCVIG